ncbi:MAG: EamA family transporter [Bryobacteraceae bacterium]|jgi:drug/metabolite transporter (DMT)-like permease|nr:EamA family transporter [Bryobacteraceae bacterium]
MLVFCCTLFGGVAQYLFKRGTAQAFLAVQGGAIHWMPLLTDYPLWIGLSCYGVSTLLMVLALRDGELSLLYPVISLTYIWVMFMSVLLLHEPLTVWKVAGVSLICLGVCLLGMNGKKAAQ